MNQFLTYLWFMGISMSRFMLRAFNLMILLGTIVVMYFTIGEMIGFMIRVKPHSPSLAISLALTFIYLFLLYSLLHYKILTIYLNYVVLILIMFYYVLTHSKIDELSQIACFFTASLCALYIVARFIGIIRKWDRSYFRLAYHCINAIIVLLFGWLFSIAMYTNKLNFGSVDGKISPPFPKFKHVKKLFGSGVWYAYFITSVMVLILSVFLYTVFFSIFSMLSINAHIFIQNIINSMS